MRPLAVCLAILTTIAFILQANAQTAFNANGANGGAIKVGWSADTCDSSIEGALRYNSSGGGNGTIQYCNGSSWTDW